VEDLHREVGVDYQLTSGNRQYGAGNDDIEDEIPEDF
jgi:hypothetical protein